MRALSGEESPLSHGLQGTYVFSSLLATDQGGWADSMICLAKNIAIFMRFSFQKTAHAALSSAANRKSGYARDDKGEGDASMESGCWKEGIFHPLGGPHVHDSSVGNVARRG